MIQVHSQRAIATSWLERYANQSALFACVLGFTETGLIPDISAAGATPTDREYTAIADAEFLYWGPQPQPKFPLPPLVAGVSPALISKAAITACHMPLMLFDAGLRHPPTVPYIALGGMAARCVSTGAALDLAVVQHLLQVGMEWGHKLAAQDSHGYLVLGECVVGGTTTALGVLLGLGWKAHDKVNSSHVQCNHAQKLELVQQGLARSPLGSLVQPHRRNDTAPMGITQGAVDPFQVVAAVGDPMQIAVAGMAIAASQHKGVLLAGGTQMLAVYALARTIAQHQGYGWASDRIVVGTTRWVVDDPSGDTVGLADLLQAPLLASPLSFATSRMPELRAYEVGYVKEGVGAGGCAIAAHLMGLSCAQLQHKVEQLLADRLRIEQHH
ncbi:nicotinate mononucleotide-dependent phosphoribosyltransferase CobT [Leptolyngbya sp. AN02str]|uniref:nicotinate mononucleotide-dependent phosphoribosyltransferase CobT n=1 Tax=Leptolyngbya sp. AN02str TaxID=3423363 RepID=UPI003D32276A